MPQTQFVGRSRRTADYRLRYTLERTFVWLGNFRRLLLRWERLSSVYRSWFTIALPLCLRHVASAA